MTKTTYPWCWALLILLILAPTPHLGAFELEIIENKLTVQADQVPLQVLLKAVSYTGIVVRIDPAINPLVSAAFKDRALEDGLRILLRNHNHAFVWKTETITLVQKANTYPQLEEIHVFRPGEKDLMVAIDASDPDADPLVTEVFVVDDKIYVPVTLGYQEREYSTTLVLDTGATGMVIHQNVADQLRIEQAEPSKARGVGGIEIDTREVQLDYVIVGPHEKKNLPASIIEYEIPEGQTNELYNGLLGISFLRDYRFIVDYNEQVIRWRP